MSRPRPPQRRRSASLPAFAATAAAIITLAGVFMPWYQTNLGTPATVGQASGWAATSVGKALVALCVIWLLAAGLALVDEFGSVRVDVRTIEGLGYLVVVCALLAAALVAYRTARPPGAFPDFLSRDYGLLVSAAGCLLGIGAGTVLAARR